MLRIIARWFISRSIDEPRRLPDWVRHWIDCDDELTQFEKLSRQLGGRLRDDAPAWIAGLASPDSDESAGSQRLAVAQIGSTRRRRRLAWSLAAGALATGALAACAWFGVGRLQSKPDLAHQPLRETNDRFIQPPATGTITASDREWLAAAWKTSRANVGQWRAEARGLYRDEVLRLPGVSAIVEPAEIAGSAAGRALATLDRSMESEQQQLTSDMKTAYSFFAYRLPASLARLVGWRLPVD